MSRRLYKMISKDSQKDATFFLRHDDNDAIFKDAFGLCRTHKSCENNTINKTDRCNSYQLDL